MKKLFILIEIIVIIGVSIYSLWDKIDFTAEEFADIDYSLYEGIYEFMEVTGGEVTTYWIDLREDGTWKDENSRMGFYIIEGTVITFYQNFLGVVRVHESGAYRNSSIILGSQTFILPDPYDAPASIESIDHYVYWTKVPNASLYEIYVNDELYTVLGDSMWFIDQDSYDLLNVKVRAIDSNNRDKDGAFSDTVVLLPTLFNPIQSMMINLSSTTSSQTIHIPSTVYRLTINGMSGQMYANISITIAERTENLEIIMNNVWIDNSVNDDNTPIINYQGSSSFLTIIESNGDSNRFKGQNGRNGANGSSGNDGGSGSMGYVAMNLKDILIRGDATLFISGGSGGDGGDGGAGTIFGSAGDGGRGGDGRVPITANRIYYSNEELIQLSFGAPGNGGDGGSGSIFGSNGTDGSKGSTNGTLPDLINLYTLFFD